MSSCNRAAGFETWSQPAAGTATTPAGCSSAGVVRCEREPGVGVRTPAVTIPATANSSPLCSPLPSLLFCKRRAELKKETKNLGFVPFHFRGAQSPRVRSPPCRPPPSSLPLPAPPPQRYPPSGAAAWGSQVAAASATSTAFVLRKAAPRQGKAAPFRSQLAQYKPERGPILATRAPNPNQQRLTPSLVSM